MRNTVLLLVAGPTLFGCLNSAESGSEQHGIGANEHVSGNSVPTIHGDPSPGVMFGEKYVFEPSAIDADSDTLSYNIQNKPAWALFDAVTGAISGQPTIGDVGVYENIVISVSDGKSSISLPAFSITVSQSALGAVTLSWFAPTRNSDGTPLQDLAGYKIYYRRSPGTYDYVVRIDNPGITTYVIEQLSPATYFFNATSFNTSGVESSFSEEVMRTVD